MRIERVDAAAFGAFRSQSLQLGPGLTVIHGPNEAGKSTWFAAIYAGLVGRRVGRGRGTRAQSEFRRRHKPWIGSQWRVGVVIELASGQRFQIGHDLATGDVTIKDLGTDRLVPVSRLERELGLSLTTEGGFDGARLLGLNRESARSTMFVAQADILAVLRNVDELQEYLQRAATSGAADTTAEQALEWIAEQRSARVGSPHVGNRPLRATESARDSARAHHADALDARHRFRALHQGIAVHEASLAAAEAELAEIDHHAEWVAIDELDARITDIGRWEKEAATLAAQGEPAVDEIIARVTTAVEGFKARGEEPSALVGPDFGALESEIAALPAMPEGPRQPERRAIEALRALNDAEAAYETLVSTTPPTLVARDSIGVSPDHLRALADRLDAVPPPEPPGLRARVIALQSQLESDRAAHATRRSEYLRAVKEYAHTQENYETERSAYDSALVMYQGAATAYRAERAEHDAARARNAAREAAHSESARAAESGNSSARRGRTVGLVVVAGGLLAVALGVLLAVTGQTPLGIGVGALGIAGCATGLVLARRKVAIDEPAPVALEALPAVRAEPHPPTPPSAPAPLAATAPGDPPEAPAELTTATTELDRWVQSVRENTVAKQAAQSEIGRLSLPDGSDQLRALARAIDDQDAAAGRAADHMRRLTAAQQLVSDCARTLAAEIGVESNDEPEEARRAFARYEAECADRDHLAREAERRNDLERALAERREREAEVARARNAWLLAATALRETAASLGLAAVDPLSGLEGWLQEQRRLLDVRRSRAAVDARLEQLLDGATIAQLDEQRAVRAGSAGERPEQVMLVTTAQRSAVEAKRDEARDQLASLQGRIRETEKALAPIPEAIEAEALAEAAARAVQDLDSYLVLAQTHLDIAKDRAHADIAPVLASTIRPWVPRVTRGRFVDVDIDVDTLMVRAVEQSGRLKDADVLSQGTMEQLFLLLRIALAKHLATTDEVAPLILDDVTVQSDTSRTIAILDLLRELSAERQIVLFTQEQEVIDWATANLGNDAVIAL